MGDSGRLNRASEYPQRFAIWRFGAAAFGYGVDAAFLISSGMGMKVAGIVLLSLAALLSAQTVGHTSDWLEDGEADTAFVGRPPVMTSPRAPEAPPPVPVDIPEPVQPAPALPDDGCAGCAQTEGLLLCKRSTGLF